MPITPNLELPLLAAAQAQKHVTVNESLSLLDATAQLAFASRSVAAPPGSPAEGERFIVPSGASGDWAGQTDAAALYLNGGWVFLTPRAGWRGWIADEGREVVYDGAAWVGPPLAAVAGSVFTARAIAFAQTGLAGATVQADIPLPANVSVLGVVGRVTEPILGVSEWRLGVDGGTSRYGSGHPVSAGAAFYALSSRPYRYTADEPLILTADGGDFTAGAVQFAVHFLQLSPPDGS